MVDLRFLANTPPFTWANLSARATADAQPGKVIPRIFPDAGVSALLLMQHYPLVQNDNHVCDEHLHRIVQLQQLGCLPKTMVHATRNSSHQCNAISALLVQILQHLHIASLVREVALQSQCQADMAQGNLTIGEVAQRPRLQKTSKKMCCCSNLSSARPMFSASVACQSTPSLLYMFLDGCSSHAPSPTQPARSVPPTRGNCSMRCSSCSFYRLQVKYKDGQEMQSNHS
mmetsp:Transcript_34718/g.56039  ORF Transcript_34718/g.56039 Transcript_34718/m.56039 type:complete len:229 (-) Transcript_34718:606-1292(-)